jgi:hypothetical protein
MAAEFLIDFDQVAQAGRGSRHRPTFRASQFEHATDPAVQNHDTLKRNVRYHHDDWFLPLVDSHVRAWLKKVRFTRPPAVSVSGAEVMCGKLADPPDPVEVAAWVRHYGTGFFTPGALEEQLLELVEHRRQFAYDQEHEREPRIAALRQVLGKEEPPDA